MAAYIAEIPHEVDDRCRPAINASVQFYFADSRAKNQQNVTVAAFLRVRKSSRDRFIALYLDTRIIIF